jgi:hypothetical protein
MRDSRRLQLRCQQLRLRISRLEARVAWLERQLNRYVTALDGFRRVVARLIRAPTLCAEQSSPQKV